MSYVWRYMSVSPATWRLEKDNKTESGLGTERGEEGVQDDA